jgi:hypothetical protein
MLIRRRRYCLTLNLAPRRHLCLILTRRTRRHRLRLKRLAQNLAHIHLNHHRLRTQRFQTTMRCRRPNQRLRYTLRLFAMQDWLS